MISYKIENDSANEWIKRITVTLSNSFNTNDSSIIVKDVLADYQRMDTAFETEEVIRHMFDEPGIDIVSPENINKYCNTDDESLMENGVQFNIIDREWKTLVIRVCPKGNNGTDDVGYDIAHFDLNISGELASFNVVLYPRIIAGEIQKNDPAAEDPQLQDSDSRVGYNWYDQNPNTNENDLFVNNNTYTSAFLYKQISGENQQWYADEPSYLTPTITPLYTLQTSSYYPQELYNSGFRLAVESKLVDNFGNYVDIPLVPPEPEYENIDEYTIMETSNGHVTAALRCDIYTQEISCESPNISRNKLVLDFELSGYEE